MEGIKTPSRMEVLKYESLASSWWIKHVGNPFLQKLASKYLAWKVRRKHGRMIAYIEHRKKFDKFMEEMNRSSATPNMQLYYTPPKE